MTKADIINEVAIATGMPKKEVRHCSRGVHGRG